MLQKLNHKISIKFDPTCSGLPLDIIQLFSGLPFDYPQNNPTLNEHCIETL
jgi:hypothetical protein